MESPASWLAPNESSPESEDMGFADFSPSGDGTIRHQTALPSRDAYPSTHKLSNNKRKNGAPGTTRTWDPRLRKASDE
jgi:hypothetical protein